MKTLYSSETIRQEKQNARKGTLLAAVLGGAALMICIVLCFGIRTANAETRRLTVIAVSTLGGWSVILLTEGLILPETREFRHEEGILLGVQDAATGGFVREDPETHFGEILSVDGVFRIPKSISFFPVTLREGEETIPLRLNARNRKDFPPAGTRIRAVSVRGYITEYEVTEHA